MQQDCRLVFECGDDWDDQCPDSSLLVAVRPDAHDFTLRDRTYDF